MLKVFSLVFLLFLLTAASGALVFIYVAKSLPDPETLTNRQVIQSTKIYDRTGEVLLYEIHGEEKRTVISFEEIPESVKKATLAIEDNEFYNHPAFDWKSIIRALLINLKKGRIAQGGSTITQQLAKNLFLTPERTWTRKIKEIILAFQLEKRYTKDQILNLYLNQIPYGANSYGIEAASQTYFQKSAKNLTLAEATLLTSLPKAPSYYSPWGQHVDELIARKNHILERMFELDFIDEKEKQKAQQIKFKFAPQVTGIKAPHFVMAVQDYLNDQYGEEFTRSAGLKVITALDWDLQQLAEKVVAEGAERNKELYEGKNAALIAQDADTGQILAMVGSKNYFDVENDGNFNVATQGLRHPGSAIKPLAYLTAFKKGFGPNTVVFDVKTEFNTIDDPEKSYQPENFDEIFRGPVNLRQSLAQSINIPSVKVLYLAGIDDVLKIALDFGITTLTERSRYGLSLVLGGGEVKLIDLAGAYSVFAQEGIKHKQTLILKITDQENKTIEEYRDQNQKVTDPQYVRLINDILSDTEARMALFANSLDKTIVPGHEIALKTGTTNDYRDAWTIGYTPSLVVGVWAGNNDNSPMQKKGSSILAAVPIWHAFMNEALKNRPLRTFNRPEPVISDKPMLNGEYVANYRYNDRLYPQIHEILYYLNQNSPQFENWEKPVIEWIKTNVENSSIYNLPLPNGAVLVNETTTGQTEINLISPSNGSFISSVIDVAAEIKSSSDILAIELYFNNSLINIANQAATNFGKNYTYKFKYQPNNVELQNSLKIKITDSSGKSAEKEIILYR